MKPPLQFMDYSPFGSEDMRAGFFGCLVASMHERDVLAAFCLTHGAKAAEAISRRALKFLISGTESERRAVALWADFVALNVWGTEHSPRPLLNAVLFA